MLETINAIINLYLLLVFLSIMFKGISITVNDAKYTFKINLFKGSLIQITKKGE